MLQLNLLGISYYTNGVECSGNGKVLGCECSDDVEGACSPSRHAHKLEEILATSSRSNCYRIDTLDSLQALQQAFHFTMFEYENTEPFLYKAT
jgi:hypothetical protein